MRLLNKDKLTVDAFDEVYNMFYMPGVMFLTHLIKNKEEAENLVQDVFLKLWLRRDKIIFNSDLKPYFFRSLRNIAFDHFKKLEKDQDLRDDYLKAMANFEVDEDLEVSNIHEIVNKAIGQLSEKRMQIVQMSYLDGKSYQEIAKNLKISKNTVKNQLVSARKILRSYLAPLV